MVVGMVVEVVEIVVVEEVEGKHLGNFHTSNSDCSCTLNCNLENSDRSLDLGSDSRLYNYPSCN